ncbi:MAG: ATP synthase F1 subunit gamma [Acutalibacteraceae bacterium]
MKNISEINRNLDAIEQTRHITNAMYLLSVSAMRKNLAQVGYNHKYMHRLCAAVKDILEKSPDIHNTFFNDDGYLGKRDTAFLVIASDKSLCGAYNYNVAAEVENQLRRVQGEGREVILYTAGLKLAEILKNRGIECYKNFDGASQYPSMQQAYRIAEELIDIYKVGYVQDVYVIFTDYVSAAVQPVRVHKLLPLAAENFQEVESVAYHAQMTYEPSVEAVFDAVVSQFMQGYLYSCLCNALVCENMARMSAMQSATENADAMLKELSTAYNSARQMAITAELTEIAAATELMQHAI